MIRFSAAVKRMAMAMPLVLGAANAEGAPSSSGSALVRGEAARSNPAVLRQRIAERIPEGGANSVKALVAASPEPALTLAAALIAYSEHGVEFIVAAQPAVVVETLSVLVASGHGDPQSLRTMGVMRESLAGAGVVPAMIVDKAVQTVLLEMGIFGPAAFGASPAAAKLPGHLPSPDLIGKGKATSPARIAPRPPRRP
jgi:hypothetical protein